LLMRALEGTDDIASKGYSQLIRLAGVSHVQSTLDSNRFARKSFTEHLYLW